MSSGPVEVPLRPQNNDFGLKRKRSVSRSPSPPRRERSPPARKRRSNTPPDGDEMAVDTEKPAVKPAQEAGFDARAEYLKLTAGTRSGGVYMPPARLRALQAEAAKDKTSAEFQRLSWDALRKSITGIVNRVNILNIKAIVPELFNENLVRGKGLFARSIMKAQAASLPFTPVFACLVAIINTKLPSVGELVLTRLVSQFRRSFKRNDKPVCLATSTFIAHLVNQSVADFVLSLEIIILLLERPTDSSVEIAVGFMKEVGAYLAEASPKGNLDAFDRFRAVLHEGTIDKRVQYMIEVLFQIRKDQYKDNPPIPEGLDLVEQDDQITHTVYLDDKLEVQEGLNVFKFDADFLQHEQEYKDFKTEVLGEDSSEGGSGSSDEDSEDEAVVEDKAGIDDKTETNLVNLRRVIYLTLQNALSYEEAVHKLLKIKINEGQEIELCNMVVECASQERTYSRYYGLIAERLCKLNRVWYDCFEQAFATYYDTIHRYETNRLRIIAKLFGHLLATDSISWSVLEAIKMNENDTTSASRIFVKIMLQEMNESMGMKTLAERFKDPEVRQHCRNMFPTDLPKNTRFSINFFTSINLGALTVEMREHLTNAQKLLMEQRAQAESSSSDSSSSDSSSDDSSSSGSDSEDGQDRRRSPSPRRKPPPSHDSRYKGRDSSPRRRRSSSSPRRDEKSRRRSPDSPVDRRRDRSRDSPRRKSYRRDSSTPPRRRESRDDRDYGKRTRSDSPDSRRRRSSTPPARKGEEDKYRRDGDSSRRRMKLWTCGSFGFNPSLFHIARPLRPITMRTISFPTNGTLDTQQSSTGHEWSSFELPYDMMFGDAQNDAHTGFGTDEKSDDVNSYGGYLHDDLQTTIEHDPEEPEDVEINPAALVQPRDDLPQSPVEEEPVETPSVPSKKAPAIVDPYAEAFLQESLGHEKWTTFSARLFELRLTGPRTKSKKQTASSGDSPPADTTATVINFLCKAEAVKEVLRTYVPHPYNPHKTLSHNFSKAPSGRVTLSRSTVLALSGWSNTQFSYWARRSEAIGVLAYHDRRLKMVADAFNNRLKGTKIQDEVAATDGVTGKGLDLIIDEVKERTGASPFIHGKHSSLDPFTVIDNLPDGTPADPKAPWVDFNAGSASAHYIPSSFQPESEGGDDTAQLQYYLHGMDVLTPTMPSTGEFEINNEAAFLPATVFPLVTSPGLPKSPGKRGRPFGGVRAKRGTKKHTPTSSLSKAEDIKPLIEKRKASGDPDAIPQTTRKRAKTNASIEDS